jgi:hypothetical protein
MAMASDQIRTTVVEATEFPDLARRFRENGFATSLVSINTEVIVAVGEE